MQSRGLQQSNTIPHIRDLKQPSIACLCLMSIADWRGAPLTTVAPGSRLLLPLTMSEGEELDEEVRCAGLEVIHDLHPTIPLFQVGETNSKTQGLNKLSNKALPCAVKAQRRSIRGRLGVWESFPGGSGKAALVMKGWASDVSECGWRSELCVGLSHCLLGSLLLNCWCGFSLASPRADARQPVWALSPPKDMPAIVGVCSPH